MAERSQALNRAVGRAIFFGFPLLFVTCGVLACVVIHLVNDSHDKQPQTIQTVQSTQTAQSQPVYATALPVPNIGTAENQQIQQNAPSLPKVQLQNSVYNVPFPTRISHFQNIHVLQENDGQVFLGAGFEIHRTYAGSTYVLLRGANVTVNQNATGWQISSWTHNSFGYPILTQVILSQIENQTFVGTPPHWPSSPNHAVFYGRPAGNFGPHPMHRW